MMEYLRLLKDGVRNLSYGDPYDGPTVQAGDVVQWAIDEIARLRQWGRLTDAERCAVMAGLRSLERTLWADPENLGGYYRDIQRDAATLRGLLKRTEVKRE